MTHGVQGLCEGVDVINTGDDPCRFLTEVGFYTTEGVHFVPITRQGGTILYTDFSRYGDSFSSENNPWMRITDVIAVTGGVNVITESDYHNLSDLPHRALVFEWD